MFGILLITLVFSPQISSTKAFSSQEVNNLVDGVITVGEYGYQQILADGDFVLYWQRDGNEIFFGLEGKTNGWVAIGINPSFMMLDADFYFGWVHSNGSTEVIDAYGTGPTGPHPPDVQLGGTNDILDYNGSETEETTIIEFKRLLVTPDSSYDNSLPENGDVKILWAIGASDSFDAPHTKRGSLQWSLEGASSFKADFSQPIILGLALVVSLSGLLIFVDSKSRHASEDTNSDEKPSEERID
jgi:hypothetical protein